MKLRPTGIFDLVTAHASTSPCPWHLDIGSSCTYPDRNLMSLAGSRETQKKKLQLNSEQGYALDVAIEDVAQRMLPVLKRHPISEAALDCPPSAPQTHS